MTVVPSFGKRILEYLGAPRGRIATYTESHLGTFDGVNGIPDGLIHIHKGQTYWVALVEVKTGSNHLDADQINRYLQIANGLGYEAMLIISNEIVADTSESPVRVDKRRTKNVRHSDLLRAFRYRVDLISDKTVCLMRPRDSAWARQMEVSGESAGSMGAIEDSETHRTCISVPSIPECSCAPGSGAHIPCNVASLEEPDRARDASSVVSQAQVGRCTAGRGASHDRCWLGETVGHELHLS